DPLIVQFIHRWFAFAAAAALMWLAIRATTAGSRAGFAIIALVTLQIILGIATLMTGVQIDVAVAHQANAALLMIAAVVAAHAAGTQPRVSYYPSAKRRFA
ncbi:COX15/CtaA family protein, partial [uncultured Sphingomonas sp.]|uniref:COX15/CtaA family protein n=1 Tax=uncultured Sphingomonas sp. TaxID=158754 RepID=UPI0035CA5166